MSYEPPGPGDYPAPSYPPPGYQPPSDHHRKKSGLGKKIAIGAAGLVALIVVIAVIGAALGSGKPKPPAHHAAAPAPAATTPAAPTTPALNLTAAELAFVNDVHTKYPNVGSSTANLVGLAKDTCSVLRLAPGAMPHMTRLLSAKVGSRAAHGVFRLAQRLICPGTIQHTIARFSGSGIENTAQFYIGGSGNWVLKWTYNCAANGSQGNFIVNEDNSFNGANVNELGYGGHGETHVYSNSGSHYLAIDSECVWTLKVVG